MLNKIPNIDTIYILTDIENYEKSEILNYLCFEKEKAIINANEDTNYKHVITINKFDFQLFPNGTQGYSYILRNDGYEIKIAQKRSKLIAFYPIQIRISSEYLWSYGLINCWSNIYEWIIKTFGNILKHKVYRIDLCCHISNIDLITGYDINYKGNFKKKELFYSGIRPNAITFGSRKNKKIYCRIYNKTLEIQETKKKTWFKEIWQNNNLDINNVWNIEFELKSDILREFNLIEVNDVYNNLKDLWIYCTSEFLIKIDRINKRIERCPVNEQWQEIQNAFNSFNSIGLIERNKQINSDANALIPNIIGLITSYTARTNISNIENAFNKIKNYSEKYLKNKNTSFEDEVFNKKKFITEKGGK